PPEAMAKRIEAEALATIKYPSDGKYIGQWQDGEKLAQNGRGMSWSDASAQPSANGGSCYNCHQISKQELSYGTIGPSLYNYGKLRGVKDLNDAASNPIVKYTWAKIWNSKAFAACSNMPRFGHRQLLDEEQIRDVMALLLDPKSPVNQ
ncbi:MAG: sulfur oxidation c-type cytochrome SoxX, partial [Aquincola sp.]|nr:sulfur oxidation c-type cytochrome SoxX [Aquincola sp.]